MRFLFPGMWTKSKIREVLPVFGERNNFPVNMGINTAALPLQKKTAGSEERAYFIATCLNSSTERLGTVYYRQPTKPTLVLSVRLSCDIELSQFEW